MAAYRGLDLSNKPSELDFLEELTQLSINEKFIGSTTKDIWKIALNPNKTKQKNKAPKGQGQQVMVGDIIKIGRMKIKLKEMKISNEQQTFSENS